MRRPLLLTVIPLALVTGCSFNPDTDLPQPPRASDLAADLQQLTRDGIKRAAEKLFDTTRAAGTKLDAGPCIGNPLVPDWVLDIAHDPRQPVDDKSENQCSAYRDGTAHHFIELTPEGKFIRMQ